MTNKITYSELRFIRKQAFSKFMKDRTRENAEAFKVARQNQVEFTRR